MDKADETVAGWLMEKAESPSSAIKCLDCGGWPINNGSVLVAVVMIRDEERVSGHMCELCYVKRIARRGRFNNAINGHKSSRTWQIEAPELGLFKDRDAKERAEAEASGSRYIEALCALSVTLGLPSPTQECREIGERFAKEYVASHPRSPHQHRNAELTWAVGQMRIGPKKFRHCPSTADGRHEWRQRTHEAQEFVCSKCHQEK